MRNLRVVLVGVLLVATATVAPAQQNDFSGKTIDELIVLLNDDSFFKRDDATNELEKRLPTLAKADMVKIVNAAFEGPLEVKARAERILGKFLIPLNMSASAKAALELLQTKLTDSSILGGVETIDFRFDKGSGKTTDKALFAMLTQKWAAFRNYLAIGDAAGAKTRLDEFKTFIQGLSNAQFASLGLTKDGQALTKDDVLGFILAARALADNVKGEIENKMGAVPEDARLLVAVAAGGPIDVGKTLGLSIGSLVTPGGLDYTMVDDLLALAEPPPKFAAFGPIFDLVPLPGLAVSSEIELSIQYGDASGVAYGIEDPRLLAVVRIANGTYQFLDFENDLDAHVIRTSYVPDSPTSGMDQFGEFMLVARVPEPPALLMLAAAWLTVALARARVRRR